jgi:hypothetical protein
VLAGVCDPAAAERSLRWSSTRVEHHAFSGIHCPSGRLCVAFDDQGNVVTNTRSATARSAWHATRVDWSPLSSLTCPAVTLCVGMDQAGNVIASRRPAAGSRAWTVTRVAGLGFGAAFSCPTPSFCAAVDGPNVVTAINPAGGATAWRAQTIDTGSVGCNCSSNPSFSYPGALVSIACTSRSMCIAGDSNGLLFESTRPTGNSSSWHVPVDLNGGGYDYYKALGVACGSRSLCVGADGGGDVVSSTRPAGPATSWRVASIQADAFETSDLVCSGTSLCLGIGTISGDGGSGIVSFRHHVGWRVTDVASGWGSIGPIHLTSVACATQRFCAAADNTGAVWTSSTPATGSVAAKQDRQ